PSGAEFQINTYGTGVQERSRVAAQSAASFVVVWQSVGQDGDAFGVFGARFDSLGAASGTEFQINTFTPNSQLRPDVAVGPSDFIVTWAESPGGQIRSQRFDSTGVKVGTDLQITPSSVAATAGDYHVRVAENQLSGFAVVWSNDTDGSQLGVFGRRFD